jgi:hypothetical protein
MKNVTRYLMLAGGLSLVTGIATLTLADLAEGQGNRPSTPVVVLNTPDQPVPVVPAGASTIDGTVSVEGHVAASQSGPWTVGVNNLPAVQNVNVLNDTLRVVSGRQTLAYGTTGRWLLSGFPQSLSLRVPAGTVLTDVMVGFSGPLCRFRLVQSEDWSSAGDTLVDLALINSLELHTIHLGSGILSDGNLHLHMISFDLEGTCSGTMTWTGYQP